MREYFYMQVPKRKSEQAVKRETGPFLVTVKAIEALKKDLSNLENALPEMIKEVERTKAHGDFSENAAYQDAKHTLRRTHGRIAQIKDRLKSAIIIEQDGKKNDTVQIGSHVTVETNGKKITFEILGSHESDPANGRISNVSPLGQLLLNHTVGEEVILKLKDSTLNYRIIEIR